MEVNEIEGAYQIQRVLLLRTPWFRVYFMRWRLYTRAVALVVELGRPL